MGGASSPRPYDQLLVATLTHSVPLCNTSWPAEFDSIRRTELLRGLRRARKPHSDAVCGNQGDGRSGPRGGLFLQGRLQEGGPGTPFQPPMTAVILNLTTFGLAVLPPARPAGRGHPPPPAPDPALPSLRPPRPARETRVPPMRLRVRADSLRALTFAFRRAGQKPAMKRSMLASRPAAIISRTEGTRNRATASWIFGAALAACSSIRRR